MTLRRLVLWRHGETDYNANRRMQGHLDSELTEVGWRQAKFAVPALARFDPTIVVASDLRRARDTAGVFTEACDVPLRIDQRLRETNLGEWQGLTGEEVDERWPGGRVTWQEDPSWAPPGGETRIEVAHRAGELISELDAQFDDTVLLCAHGGVITAVTGYLLDLPLVNWTQLGGIGNCHWTVFARRETGDGRWRMLSYNAGITG